MSTTRIVKESGGCIASETLSVPHGIAYLHEK